MALSADERLERLRLGLAAYRARGGRTGPRPKKLPAGMEPIVPELGVNDTQPLVVVRDYHHRVARGIAEGLSSRAIATKVGLPVARVSALRGNITIVGLVARHRERLDAIDDAIYATRRQKEDLLLHNALDQLNDRYMDEGESVSHEQARMDYALVSERLKEEKPNVSVQLHGNLSEMPLAELVNVQRARADRLIEATVIADVAPEPGGQSPPLTPSSGAGVMGDGAEASSSSRSGGETGECDAAVPAPPDPTKDGAKVGE